MRFNYKKIKFVTLENTGKKESEDLASKKRFIPKIFYYVSQNEERKKPVNRRKDSIENFEFIENLKFFNETLVSISKTNKGEQFALADETL